MTTGGPEMRARGLAYLTGRLEAGARPAAVGQKFDAQGGVLRYPGNTFICHIPPESTAHRALVEASAALQAGPVAGAFAFLPPSSLHMTVFEGVTGAARDDGRWPADIAVEETVEAVTEAFSARVGQMELPGRQMIRPTGIFGGFSVRVEGATPEAEASLRASREALSRVTGIRRPDFESYGFHITLAYLLRWLREEEAEAVLDLSDQVFARLVERAPTIALGPVEFCTFDDMHAFRPVRIIGPAPVAGAGS